MCACRRGRKDCIRALLEHGADTRIKNIVGKIARDCTKDIVQILDEVRNIPIFFVPLTFYPTIVLTY